MTMRAHMYQLMLLFMAAGVVQRLYLRIYWLRICGYMNYVPEPIIYIRM